MTTLYVKKVNESFLGLSDHDLGVLRELYEYYSFPIKGAKYDKRFQIGLWDGRHHLVNARNRTLPYGLLNNLPNFTNERGYDLVDETEERDLVPDEDLDNFDGWLDTLCLPFKPRDYQYNTVKHALTKHRAVILSPTGSGKSLVIYLLLRWMLKEDRKVCIIVPSTSLVEQMISDFRDYAKGDESFEVDSIVKPLYGAKKCDPFKEQVVVATWQTLIKWDSSLYETWDCVISDETHLAKAKSLQTIINGAVNAPYRFGLTGSLSGENVHQFVLMGSFGDVYQATTTVQLQEKGELSDMVVYMISLQYDPDDSKAFFREHKMDWNAEQKYLITHPVRQGFMTNLALSCKGTTIVFFNLLEHGKTMYEQLLEKAGERPVYYVDGEVDSEERERIRQAVLTDKDPILVFSVGTSATGINIPSIQNVILHNSKSRIRNLQSIGRGLRLSDQKTGCKVFDIVDDMCYSNHKNYAYKHAIERYNLYLTEGFKVVNKSVKIPKTNHRIETAPPKESLEGDFE